MVPHQWAQEGDGKEGRNPLFVATVIAAGHNVLAEGIPPIPSFPQLRVMSGEATPLSSSLASD